MSDKKSDTDLSSELLSNLYSSFISLFFAKFKSFLLNFNDNGNFKALQDFQSSKIQNQFSNDLHIEWSLVSFFSKKPEQFKER